MAATPPPKRNKANVSEADIEAFIKKGGSTLKESKIDDEEIKFVSVRMTQKIIDQINEERNKLPRKPGSPKPAISLRDWILEAALEKLERLKSNLKHDANYDHKYDIKIKNIQ